MKKLLLFVLVIFIFTGCGSSNKFVGTWYAVDGDELSIVVFKSDGTCTIEEAGQKVNCKYSYDDKNIKIESEYPTIEEEYSFGDGYFVMGKFRMYSDLETAKKNINEVEVIEREDPIVIPDVSGFSVYQAELMLTNLGFVVDDETEKEYSNVYEKGKVIGTSPAAGRSRVKGTRITIIESLGDSPSYIIEDYTGKNYIEVQAKLESVYNMRVIIMKKEVSDVTDSNVIVDQSIKPGTEVNSTDSSPVTITLYIPDVYDEYPDFVNELWTLDEVKAFAEKYSLTLDIKYEETEKYASGTIIKQSRTGKIVSGATLTITVAK